MLNMKRQIMNYNRKKNEVNNKINHETSKENVSQITTVYLQIPYTVINGEQKATHWAIISIV